MKYLVIGTNNGRQWGDNLAINSHLLGQVFDGELKVYRFCGGQFEQLRAGIETRKGSGSSYFKARWTPVLEGHHEEPQGKPLIDIL